MHILYAVIALSGIVGFTWALITMQAKAAIAVIGTNGQRNASLDGLRGLLALAVLMHHEIITRSFYTTGLWVAPTSNFDNLLGTASVALFFMASAYLFGGRLIRNEGEIDVLDFAIGRINRIAPLYYFAVIVLIAISILHEPFKNFDAPSVFIKKISAWSSFGFRHGEGINGFDASSVVLSAIWSLKYEWLLYFILPVLALLMRITRHPAALFLGLIALSFYWSLFTFFVAGILACYIVDFRSTSAGPYWRWAALAGIVTIILTSHSATGPWEAALLLPLFIAALQGGGMLKFLSWRPLRFLGQISYSIYLLHGAVLFLVSDTLIGRSVFSQLNDGAFFVVIWAIGCAVVVVSTATFLLIEKPMLIEKARPVGRRAVANV